MSCTMAVPDPDCEVLQLGYDLRKILLYNLDIDGAWKLVAEASGVISQFDVSHFEKAASPSEHLLVELNNKFCTVRTLCILLKQCNLYHILALLKDREPLEIIKQPGDCLTSDTVATVYVPLGGILRLECEAIGLPLPKYVWYNENMEIAGQTNGKLCIKDFVSVDEGEYYCCVSQTSNNDLFETFSSSVSVRILPEQPCILQQPTPHIVCQQGDNITINCSVKGYPDPEIQWFHENNMLEDQNTSELMIPCIKASQNGKYKCYVKNKAGETWSNVTEINAYKPECGKSVDRHVATEKIALLIANDIYDNYKALRCPMKDVIVLANKLAQLDFKVIALQNLNLIEMKNAVKKCCELLPEGAYVFFYFAGHGFDMQDKYMLPVDAPGPEEYQRCNSLCEKEVLRDVLDTNPKLCVILLDMCLCTPSTENVKIYDEKPEIIQYKPGRNIIQGYATTSNLAAYERSEEENGVYVKHLEKILLEDITITEILVQVGCDISVDSEVADKQIPSHSTNIVEHFYLTDSCSRKDGTEAGFKDLNWLPPNTSLVFAKVNTEATVKICRVECFINSMEIQIANVDCWEVVCATDCQGLKEEELKLERRTIGDMKYLVVTISGLQKIRTNLMLTFSLYEWDRRRTNELMETNTRGKNKKLMDNALLDLGKPLIAHDGGLWFVRPSPET